MMAIRLTSRWIMVCPFPPRFLNRAASFFDLWLYVLWPRQFQSRHNFSLPAKTVRHASLCVRLDNRVSSSSALSEARRISVSSALYIYGYCNFMRVLSLNWNYGMCTYAAGSDFITGAAHTVIPIQRQHAHKIAISVYTYTYIALTDIVGRCVSPAGWLAPARQSLYMFHIIIIDETAHHNNNFYCTLCYA